MREPLRTWAAAAGRIADGPGLAVAILLAGAALRVAAYAGSGGLTPPEAMYLLMALAPGDSVPVPPPVRWAVVLGRDGPLEGARFLSLLLSLAALPLGALVATRFASGRWRNAALALLAVAPASILDAARISPRAALALGGTAVLLLALPGRDGAAPRGVRMGALLVVGAAVAMFLPVAALPLAGVAAWWVGRGFRSAWSGGEGAAAGALAALVLLALVAGAPAGPANAGIPVFAVDRAPHLPCAQGPVTAFVDRVTAPWTGTAESGVGARSALLVFAAVALGAMAPGPARAARAAAGTWLLASWILSLAVPSLSTLAHPVAVPVIAGLAGAGAASLVLAEATAGALLRAALVAGLVVPAAQGTMRLREEALLGCDLREVLVEVAARKQPGDRVVAVPPAAGLLRLRLRNPRTAAGVGRVAILPASKDPSRYPGLGPEDPPGRLWLLVTWEEMRGRERGAHLDAYTLHAELLDEIRRPGASAYLFRTGAP